MSVVIYLGCFEDLVGEDGLQLNFRVCSGLLRGPSSGLLHERAITALYLTF